MDTVTLDALVLSGILMGFGALAFLAGHAAGYARRGRVMRRREDR